MSILDEVLVEEYDRCERIKQVYLEKLRDLPIGSLSRKIIKGRPYFYLQYRDGKKVVSQYVPKEDVEVLQKLIEDRRQYQKGVRRCEADQKKIRKAVGSLIEEL